MGAWGSREPWPLRCRVLPELRIKTPRPTRGSSKTGLWFTSAAQGFPPSLPSPQGSRSKECGSYLPSQSPHCTLSRANNLQGFRTLQRSPENRPELMAILPQCTHHLSPFWWTGKLGPPGAETLLDSQGKNSDFHRLSCSSPGNVTTLILEGIYSQLFHCSQSALNPLLTR